MPVRKVSVEFSVFETPEGQHTCGTKEGHCVFLGCRNFGTVDVCMHSNASTEETRNPGDLRRQRPYDTGYLIPHRLCPFTGIQ